MKKLTFLLVMLLSFITAFAQTDEPVKMADVMRSSGMIYVVVAVISVIFIGLAIFLFSIDRRLKKIENEK